MKIISTFFIFFYFFTPCYLYSNQQEVFKAIDNGDKEELARIFESNKKFSKIKNNQNETPLEYAIREKKIDIARFIMSNNNRVLSKYLKIAAEYLFNLELTLEKNLNISLESIRMDNFEEVLKLALTQAQFMKECNLEVDPKIAKLSCAASNFFSDRETLANWIKRRYLQGRISNENLQTLSENFYELFLEGDPLTKSSLRMIIETLYGVVSNKVLLNFLFLAFEIHHEEKTYFIKPSELDDINLRDKFKISEDPLLSAIFAKDVEYFKKFKTQNILYRASHDQIEEGISWQNILGNFVSMTILWSGAIKIAQQNYSYWYGIMKKLKTKNDFFGAAIIARSLTSNHIERIFDKKFLNKRLLEDFDFIKPEDHHASYRALEGKIPEGVYYLPDIAYLTNEFGLYVNCCWVTIESLQPTINVKSLENLANMGTKFKENREHISRIKIRKTLHKRKLDKLPNIDKDLILALSQAIKPVQLINVDINEKINEWEMEDIINFIMRSDISNKECSSILHCLVVDLGILNGHDLLVVLAKKLYLKIFRLDFHSKDEFSQIDQEQLEKFFIPFRELVSRKDINLDEYKNFDYKIGRIRFEEIKKIYDKFFYFNRLSLAHSDVVISPKTRTRRSILHLNRLSQIFLRKNMSLQSLALDEQQKERPLSAKYTSTSSVNQSF